MRPFFVLTIAFATSCAKAPSGDEFGEPIGIDLSGANLMVAVAAEKGHELPATAVPELASALVGVQRCGIKEMASVHAAVKDGALSASPDAKRNAMAACVASVMDGKPVKSLAPMKLLIQVAPAKAKP
jgi:hypothetical protein